MARVKSVLQKLDETGAFSNEDECCVLVIGSKQERSVVDGRVQEHSVQAEVVEIIIPGGNDSAVDPKSVSTSEKSILAST